MKPRTLNRTLGMVAAGALALLTLTGCLSMDANLTISPDAKGSGTLAISLQKQAAKLMGMNDLESFKTGIKQGDTTGAGEVLANAKCDPSETADNFVLTCTFTDAEFTKPDELWTVTKKDNQIVFAMKNSASAGQDTSQLTSLLGGGSLGDLTVNVTFPGAIESISGKGATKTSDTTATVKGALTDNFDVTITSATSTRPPIGMIIAIVVGVLLLLAIIIGLIVFFMRRKNKQPELAAAPEASAVGGPAGPAAAIGTTAGEGAIALGTVAGSDAEVAEAAVPEATVPEATTVDATVVDATVVEAGAADQAVVEETVVQDAVVDVTGGDVVQVDEAADVTEVIEPTSDAPEPPAEQPPTT